MHIKITFTVKLPWVSIAFSTLLKGLLWPPEWRSGLRLCIAVLWRHYSLGFDPIVRRTIKRAGVKKYGLPGHVSEDAGPIAK